MALPRGSARCCRRALRRGSRLACPRAVRSALPRMEAGFAGIRFSRKRDHVLQSVLIGCGPRGLVEAVPHMPLAGGHELLEVGLTVGTAQERAIGYLDKMELVSHVFPL